MWRPGTVYRKESIVIRRYFLVVAVLACAGCGASGTDDSSSVIDNLPDSTEERFTIVCTTAMVSDVVKQVVGEHAEVVGLLGESVDPHIYQPNRGDMQRLGSADLVIYSGLLLEGKFDDAFDQLEKGGKPVVGVTEQIEKSYLRFPKEFDGHPDPHVWMDVAAWSRCVEEVAKHAVIHLPEHEESILENAAAYRASLQELDDYVKKVIASIPEEQRVLVTAHDAFGYFARAYSIEVKAPQGITTESSPGVNDINRLVDFLVERKVKSIFIESSVSQENIQALIEGAKQQGLDVAIKGPLYSDAMGPAGEYAGTYIGMLDHNATLITRALGGNAPPGGMQGKLDLSEKAP